jgi:hypothetical protein
MSEMISLAMLQAIEVDPDPLAIPRCPRPRERLDDRVQPTPPRRRVWPLLATLLRSAA